MSLIQESIQELRDALDRKNVPRISEDSEISLSIHAYGGSKLPALILANIVSSLKNTRIRNVRINPEMLRSSDLHVVISFGGQTHEITNRLPDLFVLSKVIFIGKRSLLEERVRKDSNHPFIILSKRRFARNAVYEILGILFNLLEDLCPTIRQHLSNDQIIQEFQTIPTKVQKIFEESISNHMMIVSSYTSTLLGGSLFLSEDCGIFTTCYTHEDFIHGPILGLYENLVTKNLKILLFEHSDHSPPLFNRGLNMLDPNSISHIELPSRSDFSNICRILFPIVFLSCFAERFLETHKSPTHRSLEYLK